MQSSVSLEVLCINVNFILDKKLNIFAFALKDCEVERRGILIVNLIDIHLKSLHKANNTQRPRVGLSSTVHCGELIMHLG